MGYPGILDQTLDLGEVFSLNQTVQVHQPSTEIEEMEITMREDKRIDNLMESTPSLSEKSSSDSDYLEMENNLEDIGDKSVISCNTDSSMISKDSGSFYYTRSSGGEGHPIADEEQLRCRSVKSCNSTKW